MHCLRAWAILTLGLLASCRSFDEINLTKWGEENEFELTQNEAPQYAEPISLVYTGVYGFYLFGALPIVSATMEDCLHEIVNKARSLGADGVAHLEVKENPASFFSLESAWPFPWTAAVEMTGMAYKHTAHSRPPR